MRKTAEWNFETFHSELVARHNELRKKHATSSLTVLKNLSTLCQKTVYKNYFFYSNIIIYPFYKNWLDKEFF